MPKPPHHSTEDEGWLPPILMTCGPMIPVTRGHTTQGYPFLGWRPVQPMTNSVLTLRTIYISATTRRPSSLMYEYVMDRDGRLYRYRGLFGDPEVDESEPWVPNALEDDLGLPDMD